MDLFNPNIIVMDATANNVTDLQSVNPVMIPVAPTISNMPTNSTRKMVISIDQIDMTIAPKEFPVYRREQMVQTQTGRAELISHDVPISFKMTIPERKMPCYYSRNLENCSHQPYYDEVGIRYNYGNPGNPQWDVLSYTYGHRNAVWFSPLERNELVCEPIDAESGKPITIVNYLTSCLLDRFTPTGQRLIKFYDDLLIVLAHALKSPLEDSSVAGTVGLDEMDPKHPKSSEIHPFYKTTMKEDGVPSDEIGATYKIFVVDSDERPGKDQIKARFVGITIVNDMILHHCKGYYYLLDNRVGHFYMCDDNGNFNQIDPASNRPIPIMPNGFGGSIVPVYTVIDPLTLMDKEFLGVPIVQVKGFRCRSNGTYLNERITSMIVLDVRDPRYGKCDDQIVQISSSFDFTLDRETIYSHVGKRLAQLNVKSDRSSDTLSKDNQTDLKTGISRSYNHDPRQYHCVSKLFDL